MSEYVILREEDGKTHIIRLVDKAIKHKGLGVFNPKLTLGSCGVGDEVLVGQKYLTIMPTRLPELISSMARRAQTISSKDAGFLITKLGVGPGDTVLEAGLGSGGLSLHLARVLGSSGHLITAEPRTEHSKIGLLNLERASKCFFEFPKHTHFDSIVEDIEGEDRYDAIILDMPEHSSAIHSSVPFLKFGGRLACYAPTSSQLENCWKSCSDAGLKIDWAGEVIDREWGIASKGGMRPINGPIGHTAFLLIAQKR
ncbi:MAG: hypothetical protein CMB16_02735 [Euryarchaeota archaeon]|nr:hypothetical protein [Euryarchaeota archaeon]|tara:strand:+ start:135 stop:899 length:765 start_codon:yes stop_codon:yes gene_type:complete